MSLRSKFFYIIDKADRGFKSVDRFETPISLAYKGETHFKTWVGGLCTIILIVGFAIFTITELIKLAEKKKIETSKNEIYFDVTAGQTEYNFTKGSFYFAFRVNSLRNLTLAEEQTYMTWGADAYN